MTDLSTTASVLAALASAAVLAVLHLLAPRIRRLPFVPKQAMGSFAGGLAVAYVLLHLLPELSEGNKAVGEALQEVVTRRRTAPELAGSTSVTDSVGRHRRQVAYAGFPHSSYGRPNT